jgi:hypothetical protein
MESEANCGKEGKAPQLIVETSKHNAHVYSRIWLMDFQGLSHFVTGFKEQQSEKYANIISK